MEKANEKVIKQLNNIVEINNDRIQGYEKAAKEIQDSDLKALFADLASHSSANNSELSAQIMLLGGEPIRGTKTTGKIFRAWMDVKAALTGKDRKEIISSCETGEDAALETYDDVINADAPFSDNLRNIISKQRAELQMDHDKIRTLRDMAKLEKV